jgi:hypothetical protein
MLCVGRTCIAHVDSCSSQVDFLLHGQLAITAGNRSWQLSSYQEPSFPGTCCTQHLLQQTAAGMICYLLAAICLYICSRI